MRQFGVSRMTANRSLRELAAEGLVTRLRGSGTRVAALHRIASRLTIRDIHEEILERGHEHATRVLTQEAVMASTGLAQSLGLAVKAQVFHTVLIHLENGIPIQYEDRFVNPAAAPGYLACDFLKETPTHHLLAHAPLTEATYNIEAVLPSAVEARHLGIKRKEACLAMVRRTVSGAQVASVARTTSW